MKATITTTKLQEAVSRVAKGVGNNKLLPITSLLGIESSDGSLCLTATDGTNYLYIKTDGIEGDDLNITIPADVFIKLIGRMTSDETVLTLNEGTLTVSGNGKYTIELPLDETGNLIKYPDPATSITINDRASSISKSVVDAVIESIKPALATTFENPCYTGYYAGDRITATDTYKIASLDAKLFDEPVLVSPAFLDLLSVMSQEEIKTYVDGNKVLCDTDDCRVYGVFMNGIEDYAIDAISGLVDTEYDSMCVVPKQNLLQLLDRLALFVSPYDKNAVTLTFTQEGLLVSSKASRGTELIEYARVENFADHKCSIDIEMLRQEVKAMPSEQITIYYGSDTTIKLVDHAVTVIIALLEER